MNQRHNPARKKPVSPSGIDRRSEENPDFREVEQAKLPKGTPVRDIDDILDELFAEEDEDNAS